MRRIEKKIILTFLAISSLSIKVYASNCEKAAQLIGSGRGVDQLNSDCIEYVKKQTPPARVIEDLVTKKKIMSHKNMILIEKENGQNDLIAGKSTGLSEVVAITKGFSTDEIIVLDIQGKVMTFNIGHVGNIGPIRVFNYPGFAGAKQIFADKKNQEIIVFNHLQKKAYFFSVFANSKNKKAKKFSVVSRVVKGVSQSKLNIQDGSVTFYDDVGSIIK